MKICHFPKRRCSRTPQLLHHHDLIKMLTLSNCNRNHVFPSFIYKNHTYNPDTQYYYISESMVVLYVGMIIDHPRKEPCNPDTQQYCVSQGCVYNPGRDEMERVYKSGHIYIHFNKNQISNCIKKISDFRSKFQISKFRFQNSDFRKQISDFRFQILESRHLWLYSYSCQQKD